jgi:glutathione S-transferase
VEDYKLFFLGRAKSIETALGDGRKYLVADRFSIADICVGYALFLASTLGIADELGERCQAYLKRLTAREAFISARQRQST